jgi:hypothetical protein
MVVGSDCGGVRPDAHFLASAGRRCTKGAQSRTDVKAIHESPLRTFYETIEVDTSRFVGYKKNRKSNVLIS